MAKNKFSVGDRVMLKSGGPPMTVKSVPNYPPDEHYSCQWFAGKKLESGEFPAESLKEVEDIEAEKK